jgi:hypothetical protein
MAQKATTFALRQEGNVSRLNHEQTDRIFQSCIIHRIEKYPVP